MKTAKKRKPSRLPLWDVDRDLEDPINIIKIRVSEFFHIGVEELAERTRKQPIAWARQIAMFLAFTAYGGLRNSRHIAKYFRNTDSNVRHSSQLIDGYLSNPRFALDLYQDLRHCMEHVARDPRLASRKTQQYMQLELALDFETANKEYQTVIVPFVRADAG